MRSSPGATSRRRRVRGTLGDDAKPGAFEHRERARERGLGGGLSARIHDDGVGLEHLGALLSRKRDRCIEQRAGHATTTGRHGHREAGDRPDWTIVDRWDHPRANDAFESFARQETDPADRSRILTVAFQRD
jgi:hypothetical protein